MQSRNRALKAKEDAKNSDEDLIKFEMLRPGDATHYPQNSDSVAVHYVAYLEDGIQIDNSYERGQPLYFVLGSGTVIKGWEKVLLSGISLNQTYLKKSRNNNYCNNMSRTRVERPED